MKVNYFIMLFISSLTEAEIISLQAMNRAHPLVWTRICANAVLLNHAGQSIKQMASLYGVCRQTIEI